MTVSFDFIPATVRVPGAYAEFDNSRALRGLLPTVAHRILVLGQRLAAGTVAAEIPTQILTAAQAAEAFGRGSMLHRMFGAIEANNGFTRTDVIALDDAVAGVAATGSLAITGPASAAGTLAVYIGGRRVRVAVAAADDANSVAAALAGAINADLDLPVTAAAVLADVNLTARHKGENGNDIDLRLNYFDEDLPAGIGIAVTAMAGGAANPDVADALAAIGGVHYNHIVMPWTDPANLTALTTELATNWQPTAQKESQAWAGKAGTAAALSTFGAGLNSPLLSVVGLYDSPTPPEEIAAAYAARAAFHLEADPARPLNKRPLTGVLAPPAASQFTFQEANILLHDGVTPGEVLRDGTVVIMRAVTTFQTDSFGFENVSYLDVTTPATLAFLRLDWRAHMSQLYPNHKIADDGTRVDAGQAIATPNMLKASTIARARLWEGAGLVEGLDQFKKELIVVRNQGDATRVDFVIPPDLVNGLHIMAAKFQFLL